MQNRLGTSLCPYLLRMMILAFRLTLYHIYLYINMGGILMKCNGHAFWACFSYQYQKLAKSISTFRQALH